MLGDAVIRLGDRFLSRANRRLANAGASPHLMNGLEMLSALACGVCFAQHQIPGAVILLVVHGCFDYLDGGLRRAAPWQGKRTVLEPFLHTIADKVSDAVLFFSLAWGGLVPWWLGVTATLATVSVSLLGWWAHNRRGIAREACLFDRSDRLLVLVFLTPLSLFVPAVLATVFMNAVIFGQRIHAIIYARSGAES